MVVVKEKNGKGAEEEAGEEESLLGEGEGVEIGKGAREVVRGEEEEAQAPLLEPEVAGKGADEAREFGGVEAQQCSHYHCF